MGIYHPSAVHASSAATHQHSLKVLEEGFQADLMNEFVLGRNMASAEYYPMGILNQPWSLPLIPPVQHRDTLRLNFRAMYAIAHSLQDRVGEALVIRSRAYKQNSGRMPSRGFRERRFDIG